MLQQKKERVERNSERERKRERKREKDRERKLLDGPKQTQLVSLTSFYLIY